MTMVISVEIEPLWGLVLSIALAATTDDPPGHIVCQLGGLASVLSKIRSSDQALPMCFTLEVRPICQFASLFAASLGDQSDHLLGLVCFATIVIS